jgi:hypothetical protein
MAQYANRVSESVCLFTSYSGLHGLYIVEEQDIVQ